MIENKNFDCKDKKINYLKQKNSKHETINVSTPKIGINNYAKDKIIRPIGGVATVPAGAGAAAGDYLVARSLAALRNDRNSFEALTKCPMKYGIGVMYELTV